MNCREAERLLDTFFDGELDGRLMRDAALHITRCQSCEREVRAKEGVRDLLVGTIEQGVQGADLSSIWAGVEAGIRGDVPVDVSTEESPRRRLFGRRSGGRHGGGRTRTVVRRVSAAAGMGAMTVGLAAFLLFPVESGERLADSEPGTPEKAPVQVAAPGRSVPVPAQRAVAAAKPATRSSVATVALGPVPRDEPLSSEWPQQVQAGVLEYDNHAMSLWSDTGAR